MSCHEPGHGAKGAAWEKTAETFLRRRGLKTLTRRFRVRSGEIDLIMEDGESLVFIEVRYRARRDYGTAADSVTLAKQGRIVGAARQFLGRHRRYSRRPCRFDVVSIQGGAGKPEIHWIKGAFGAES